MNALVRTAVVTLGAAAAAVTMPAIAGAAPITVSAFPKYTYLGSTVALKVKAEAAGPLVVVQTRRNNVDGPGRCDYGSNLEGADIASNPVARVPYLTPGETVTIRIPAARLQYFGGNPLAQWSNDGPDDCIDHPTQYKRVVVFQQLGSSLAIASRPLIRVL